jgi:hypothetical protein
VSPDFASLRFGYKLPELRKNFFIRCCTKGDWFFLPVSRTAAEVNRPFPAA